MSDLIKALRFQGRFGSESEEQARLRRYKERNEAADRIEADACRIEELERRNAELEAALNAKQAEIDRLMLEYCPDEMTIEQVKEWERHQRPATSAANPPDGSLIDEGSKILSSGAAKGSE